MPRFSFIAALALLALTADARADYWGLRNISERLPDEAYRDFDADLYCFGVSWARTETADDQFNWDALNNSLDFAERYQGATVLVVSCDARWATAGQTRAPDDLDRRTPLNSRPPERGYSESLYDFAYNLTVRCAGRDRSIVRWLRFVNEPEYNWAIGRDYAQDVEDYVRCLRTFYLGAHAAATECDLDVRVSHGGFTLSAALVREYYRLGERDEALQDSLIALLQSRFERHSTRVRTWADVANLAQGRGGMPPTYWTDVMAGQTAWLDWFDVHYHFKPRFLTDELHAFEAAVRDSGGELRPWLAAEAAMQLAEGGLTEYDERFQAGDMARKWILGFVNGLEGICTPIVGYPPEHFFGLFDSELNEYSSAQVYRHLRRLIDRNLILNVEDLSERDLIDYRFVVEDRNDFQWDDQWWGLETIWMNALSDADSSRRWIPMPERPEREDPYYDVVVASIFQEELARYQVRGDRENLPDSIEIGQEPTLIYWDYFESVEEEPTSPARFRFLTAYPNPFNAIVNVRFSLAGPTRARLTAFDLTGARIEPLFDGPLPAGAREVIWDARGVPAGVYLIRLETENELRAAKAVLIR